MLKRIMGAMVGGAIDRRDGKGGLKGAVIGAVAARAVSRAGPIGLAAIGAAVGAKLLYDHRKAKRAGQAGIPASGPPASGRRAE